MLRDLKKLVKLHGWAYVAYRVGLRDTWALKKWVERKSIPEEHKLKVKEVLRSK